MRTLTEAKDYFAYHPATPGPDGTGAKHAAVRDLFAETLIKLWDLVPDGPDKTVMVRSLWETCALANLAIALTAPADTSETRSVARVLPLGTTESFGFKPQHPLGRCGDPHCGGDWPPDEDDEHDYSDPKRVHATDVGLCDC